MKKCIIFARCSTLQQFTESQTDVLVKWAEQCEYPPAQQIIIEEQESGIKLKEEERLGINKMKKFIESDPDIDCLFANEVSDVQEGSIDTNTCLKTECEMLVFRQLLVGICICLKRN